MLRVPQMTVFEYIEYHNYMLAFVLMVGMMRLAVVVDKILAVVDKILVAVVVVVAHEQWVVVDKDILQLLLGSEDLGV